MFTLRLVAAELMSHALVPVWIRWLRREEGGRIAPPNAPHTTIPVRFAGQEADWLRESWSLRFHLDGPQTAGAWIKVRAENLFDAPDRFLLPGTTFELMDGPQRVALGAIDDGSGVPPQS